MAIIVVADTLINYPEINPPEVEPFPLQIDVTPPLPPPCPPTSLPLTTEYLPLMATFPSTSDSVTDK